MSDQGTAAAAESLKAALADLEDDEGKGIEVEVTGDDLPEAQEEEGGSAQDVVRGAAAVAPGKKRPRYKETVVRLKGDLRQTSEAAQRLFDENQKLKRDMESLSQSGMANYERGLAAEQRLAQITLKTAIQSDDADAQATAQAEVARIASEMNDIKAWKAQNPPRPVQQQPQQPQFQQPQQDQRPQKLAEPVQKWIDANPWFDERTEEFDEDMHYEAVEFARVLEARLIRQGRANEINTDAYFKQIQDHVATQYASEEEGEEAEQAAPEPRRVPKSPVAGVARVAPAAQNTGSKRNVSLSADEVAMVRKNVAEKAVRHAWDHRDPQKRGQPKTFDEAISDYARRKMQSEANPSERQRSRN